MEGVGLSHPFHLHFKRLLLQTSNKFQDYQCSCYASLKRLIISIDLLWNTSYNFSEIAGLPSYVVLEYVKSTSPLGWVWSVCFILTDLRRRGKWSGRVRRARVCHSETHAGHGFRREALIDCRTPLMLWGTSSMWLPERFVFLSYVVIFQQIGWICGLDFYIESTLQVRDANADQRSRIRASSRHRSVTSWCHLFFN